MSNTRKTTVTLAAALGLAAVTLLSLDARAQGPSPFGNGSPPDSAQATTEKHQQDKQAFLEGTFATVSNFACLTVHVPDVNTPGFNANLSALSSPGFVSFSTYGEWTFSRGGTGTKTGQWNNGVTLGGATGVLGGSAVKNYPVDETFTYSLSPDGKLEVKQDPLTTLMASGPLAGWYRRVTNQPASWGHISMDKKSFLLNSGSPTEITIEILPSLNQAPVSVSKRMCHSSVTGIRISD